MDDKRDGKKKEKKRSRSRSRDNKRRSPSRSPSYGRRRRDRSRSRDRARNRRVSRSPVEMRRRGRGRRSPSPPPPPSLQAPPPPMIAGGGVAPPGYPAMYDAYGGYATAPPPGPYMGDMSQTAYGGYEYRAAPGPAPVAVDGYGGILSGPPPQIMMVSQPGPPGEEYGAAAAAANASGWNAPPPAIPVVQENEEEKRKREAAIATEVRNQRASLKKQRDDYMQRAGALKRELKILKQQRADLSSGREPPSPTTNSFIKENDKLQSQIQTKLSTIENVIDMLEGIIGKDRTPTPPPPVLTPRTPPEQDVTEDRRNSPTRLPAAKERKDSASSASPERLKNEVLETMKRGKGRKEEKSSIKTDKSGDSKPAPSLSQVNHVFYDPELHWCSTCDIFPKTAKDYLNHLHSTDHTAKAAAASQEYPWRDKLPDSDEPVNNPALPPKRVPIRGLQFFVPAPAWYCKLCNYWMGDLHCASTHLKSSKHRECYGQYIESHANFEIDWMSDRQKAYERMRDLAPGSTPFGGGPDSGPNDFLTSGLMPVKDGKKKKSKKEDKKDKKKKKRSKKKKKRAASSSSSDSSSDSDSDPEKKSAKGDEFDPATSIRVAMRNLLKAQEAASKEAKAEETAAGKWTVVQTAAVAPKELTAPPPPFMTEGAESREKKRDELMISQWVTPEPIISEKEKQMLEQLKGKLKKREEVPPPPKSPPGRFREPEDNFRRELDDRRRISRSPTPPWRRNRSPLGRRGSPGGFGGRGRRSPIDRRGRSPLDRGMRDRSVDRRRDRSMDRGGRSSRDRDMNRGFGGGRFDRRRGGGFGGRRSPSPNFGRGRFRPRRSFSRSRTRSRSRSRTRSRSRGRRVIEKPIVNFPPEPKPKLTKKSRDKKDDDKKDKKPVSMSIPGQKKLPFIGRMPVFKKQQQDAKKEEITVPENMDLEEPPDQENGTKTQPEEFGDMMPDPYQYVALMGAAPPPPPNSHPGKPDQSMLPPGIDEAEAADAPKPISDAPIPRKGPLPKDFQQALDILFDGDKPKPADVIANETKPPELPPPPPVEPATIDTDQPQMIVPEAIEMYNQQMAAQYSSAAVVSSAAVSYQEDDESQNQPLEMTGLKVEKSSPPLVSIPTPASEEEGSRESKNGTAEPEQEAIVIAPKVEVENEETRRKRAELEELAMLGIDADDMAAQIF